MATKKKPTPTKGAKKPASKPKASPIAPAPDPRTQGHQQPAKQAHKPAKTAAEPKKIGRPTKFDAAIVDTIIQRVSEGTPLRRCLRELTATNGPEHVPGATQFYAWVNADPRLSERVARAREEGYDAIAEETLDIADDGSNDYTKDKDGHDVLDSEHIQRSKLRIETRLKLLAKWDPKRYGDKMDHTVSVHPTAELFIQNAAAKST